MYDLTATNTSPESAHNVRIDDSIPEYTTHSKAGGLPTISAGTITVNPNEGDTGLIGGNAGSVVAGGSVTLIFGVRVE